MLKTTRKTSICSKFLLLFLIGISVCHFSCKKEYKAKKMPPAVSSYVYAYTSGTISKKSPIKVRFTSPLMSREAIGTELDKNILSFKPSIKGLATWEDEQTIVFQPEQSLNSKTNYVGIVSLHKLFDNVPANIQQFEFDFQTREQHFDVRLGGLEFESVNEPNEQQLKGRVMMSDVADNKSIEKLITAKQEGKALNVKWEHLSDLEHRFTVEKVLRKNKESQVEVYWNGKPMGLSKKGSRNFAIPAIGNFKVMNTRLVQEGQQYILINFSDPLLQDQDLKGLIGIDNNSDNLRYVINGSEVRVYTRRRVSGEHKINVEAGIKNSASVKMDVRSEWDLIFEDAKPEVRLVGKGVILPNSDGLIFPFEAISLNAIEVEVVKIYNNNILQFLQTNQLDGKGQLKRVGKILLQKKLSLQDLNPNASVNDWTRYAIDLGKLINEDPSAIYQIRIGFRPEYAAYYCGNNNNSNESAEDLTVLASLEDDDTEIISIWDDNYYGINGYYSGYRWSDRNDPCKPAYYSNRHFIQRNVFASNLGIITKQAKDRSIFTAVTDLRNANPLAGVTLDFYNYQQQLIKTVTTDGDGTARTEMKEEAFVVVATRGEQKGYLRLMDPNSLSLSRFDVAGAETQKGLKGFIYGERGVWRPGDSLFLNFVLEDKSGKLPGDHPINLELYDPRGQVQQKKVTSENINNVYPLTLTTSPEAPTGNWRAVVKVGGASFEKQLKIETVKPNRLKIDLDFGKEQLTAVDKTLQGKLQVNWLHGAPAQNLKAKVEVQLKSKQTSFDTFKEYHFDDPARSFTAEPQVVFEDQVDKNGTANFKSDLKIGTAAPGKLKASFKTRAFENGGDFSTDAFTMEYSPFESYTGVYLKKNKYGQKRLARGKENQIDFIAVDENGKALSGKNLSVGLYRVNWRWWWDRSSDEVTSFNSSNHFNAIESATIISNAKGEANWSVNINNWGRYLVRVCDNDSGHCSGDFFYSGYPSGEGQNREAAAMLAFSSDKKSYNVGDEVELNIPTGEEGRCLISIENGTKVVQTFWMDAKAGENKFKFYATKEMTPTIYANVSLVQPHAQVKNDLPIRMYGVIPIKVEDPNTKLQPTIKMMDVLKPETEVAIEIAEKDGKPMAYTIALVDDGLLDLTRFRTPNPHDVFYAREALGVKTWDVYDQVLGAYGGELERILSIGGDGVDVKDKADKKANRFKPVVKHIGPFYLEGGKKQKHTITIPNYVGSVRTMVVASNNGAYGNAEKTTPVRKPLMVLATLPRVLGPTEQLTMPVNVFAMEQKVKNVTVTLEETSGLVKIIGDKTKSLQFNKPGDEMLFFDLDVKESLGIAKFKVTAKSGNEIATQEIEIDVRNPNPYVTDVYKELLNSDGNWTQSFDALGMPGTNEGILEVSNIPPINMGERLNYLLRYPHGCIEQTTSSGFPQLYVGQLMDLNNQQKNSIPKNIQATIDRLKLFQLSSGAFSYWPGDSDFSSWGTNYAGHFLLEAKKLGYTLPPNMIERWTKFQKKVAKKWDPETTENYYGYGSNKYLIQAYRLYALALAGSPEWGAMNRLKEIKNLGTVASWRLAAAYALAGKQEVAKDIARNLNRKIDDYCELSYSYGSTLRDEAMIMEALTLMKDQSSAAEMAKLVSEKLSADQWYGTQTVAYSLLAIGKFVGNSAIGDQFEFAYQIGDGSWTNASSKNPIMHIEVPVDVMRNKSVSLRNKGNAILYGRLILTGQPLVGDQTKANNNLDMTITYKTVDGKDLDPTRIQQGTDFIAEVKIMNPGKRGDYDEMALSQIFPSGWEIHNSRMDNVKAYKDTNTPEYQDIRDDRVYTYFDIRRNKSQIYRVQLNAAYQGRFYRPTVYCEAMYDNTINARQPGEWIQVVAAQEL